MPQSGGCLAAQKEIPERPKEGDLGMCISGLQSAPVQLAALTTHKFGWRGALQKELLAKHKPRHFDGRALPESNESLLTKSPPREKNTAPVWDRSSPKRIVGSLLRNPKM